MLRCLLCLGGGSLCGLGVALAAVYLLLVYSPVDLNMEF